MYPTFKSGDVILATSLVYIVSSPKKGEIIVLSHPNKGIPIVKRIKKVTKTGLFVEGDNTRYSTDSKQFGFVSRKNILGKVLCAVPMG